MSCDPETTNRARAAKGEQTMSQDVTIQTSAYYLPSPKFTWSSTGGIADAGMFEFLVAHWGGVKSPAVGTLHVQIAFLGAKGAFSMKLELIAKATATPDIYSFTGPWQLSSGSGTYATVKGAGQAEIIGRVDQQSTASDPELGTLTGKIGN